MHLAIATLFDIFLFYLVEGRYPSFEVRKTNQEVRDEAEPISVDQYSLDKKPEIVPKNDPLVNDDISYDVESSLRVHQLEEENSCKDENSLCIFLYGVMYHRYSWKS